MSTSSSRMRTKDPLPSAAYQRPTTRPPPPPPLPRMQNRQYPSPTFNESHISHSSATNASSYSLADLSGEEKAKVARLVDRLVSLAKEHEELLQVLANERSQRSEDTQRIADQFRSEIKLLEEKVKRTEEDTIEAQSKRGMAIGMLSLYQNKIVQLNEENNKLSKQLLESNHTVKSVEDQVKTLEALTASQRGTIESLTASKAAETETKVALEKEILQKDELLLENQETISSLDKSYADAKVKLAATEDSNKEYMEKNKVLETENANRAIELNSWRERYEKLEEEERGERKLLNEEHMKYELEHQRSSYLEQEKTRLLGEEREKERLTEEKGKELLRIQQEKYEQLKEQESRLLREEREKYLLLEKKDNDRYAALKLEEETLLKEEREKYAVLQTEELKLLDEEREKYRLLEKKDNEMLELLEEKNREKLELMKMKDEQLLEEERKKHIEMEEKQQELVSLKLAKQQYEYTLKLKDDQLLPQRMQEQRKQFKSSVEIGGDRYTSVSNSVQSLQPPQVSSSVTSLWSQSDYDNSNNDIVFVGGVRPVKSTYKEEQIGILNRDNPVDGPIEKVLEKLVNKTESNAQAIVKLDEMISSKKKIKKVKSRKGGNGQEKNSIIVLRTQPAVVQRSNRRNKARKQVSVDNDAIDNNAILPFVIANPLSKRHPVYQPADRADTHIWQGYDHNHPDPYENISSSMRDSTSSQSPGRLSKKDSVGIVGDVREIFFDVKYDTSSLLNLIEDLK